MTPKRCMAALFAAAALAFVASSQAGAEQEPFLHPLFGDNAVLQRDIEFPVWGWTTPGAKVTVTLGAKSAEAVAGDDGRWTAKLGPLPAGGPHTLKVAGAQTVELENIMMGDVWICSGQSNMQQGIGACANPKEEIAAANYPNIRLFVVPNKTAMTPRKTIQQVWDVCSPATVAQKGWGGFSAAGYYFGRHLHKNLDVPIGLIHSSWGGTIAEAWTSIDALAAVEVLDQKTRWFQDIAASLEDGTYNYDLELIKYWARSDVGTRAGWAFNEFDDAAWKTMKLPANWEHAGLPDFDGLVWFRTEFDAPRGVELEAVKLHLGPVDDIDTTWINGIMVGETKRWNTPRVYQVPAGIVRPGRNVVAVRVLDTGGGGGLFGKPQQMKLEIPGKKSISLAGNWKYEVSGAKHELPRAPQNVANNPNVPSVLYNAMIAPLVPYGIKGAIWYQGESNAGEPKLYHTLLPTLIADWRARFGVGEFPFFIVQLANFMHVSDQPIQEGWAAIRESQLLISEEDPKVGLAVIIDVGEANDIHPKNKQDVGKRLALSARGIAYGETIAYSGPVMRAMTIEGGSIRITFEHANDGLVAKGGGDLKGFAIAGADKQWRHATAIIDGDTVMVSSDEVKEPVAVRYAWANNPICNLYNGAGLPASPFRTDR